MFHLVLVRAAGMIVLLRKAAAIGLGGCGVYLIGEMAWTGVLVLWFWRGSPGFEPIWGSIALCLVVALTGVGLVAAGVMLWSGKLPKLLKT